MVSERVDPLDRPATPEEIETCCAGADWDGG